MKVTGTAIDDNQANNTASDYAAPPPMPTVRQRPAVPPSLSIYRQRVQGELAIGVAGQTCKAYSAATQGGKAATIYLTATNARASLSWPMTREIR